MLSGGRPCLKRASESISKQGWNSKSPEPLLFLYPRWFRTSCKTSQEAQIIQRVLSGNDALDFLETHNSKRIGGGHKKKSPAHDRSVQSSRSFQKDSSNASNTLINGGLVSDAKASISHQGNALQKDDSRRDILLASGGKVPKAAQIPQSMTVSTGLKLADKEDSSSSLDELKVEADESNSLPTRRIPSSYKARKFRFDPRHVPYLSTLKQLQDSEIIPPRPKLFTLYLLPKTIHFLTGVERENYWMHNDTENCKVFITKPGDFRKHLFRVDLEGSHAAVKATCMYLQRIEAQLVRRDDQDSTISEPVFRRTLVDTKRHYLHHATVGAQIIPQPQTWTVRSFADYVEKIARMRVPASIRRRIYEDDITHNSVVAALLEQVFTLPETKYSVSFRALDIAFRFAKDHSEVRALTMVLFNRALYLGLMDHPQLYNLVLETALKHNEIQLFQYCLEHMKQANLSPDGDTYGIMLRLKPSNEIKIAILQEMKQKGFLREPRINSRAAGDVIEDFMPIRRDVSPEHFDHFIKSMDKIFGVRWLRTETFDKLLEISGRHKIWSIVPAIAQLGHSRQVHYRASTLKSMLLNFYRRSSLIDSITLLTSRFTRIVGRDDEKIMSIVFFNAWNNRRFNVCRVLWRFCASRAIINNEMLRMVAMSLKSEVEPGYQKLSPAALARQVAGKIIVGHEGGGGFIPGLDAVHIALQEQELLWETHFFMRTHVMLDCLQKAYELDLKWSASNALRSRPLKDLIEEAIVVPLYPRYPSTVKQ